MKHMIWLVIGGAAVLTGAGSVYGETKAEALLRQRAQSYYDLLVAGQVRATEAYVCKDGLDAYFAQAKSRPKSARVQTVSIKPNERRATVVTLVDDIINFGGTSQRMAMPHPTLWRMDEHSRKWCLDVLPPKGAYDTPLGKMRVGTQPGAAAAAPSSTPQTPPGKAAVDVAAQSNRVEFSKESFHLAPDQDGQDRITVHNGLYGPIDLQIACPRLEGLSCKPSTASLAAGESATIEVSFAHQANDIPAGLAVRVTVIPFGRERLLPIDIK